MALNTGTVELTEDNIACERRIYLCETGSVRIEERNYRQTFSPEEFVILLRRVFRQTKGEESN